MDGPDIETLLAQASKITGYQPPVNKPTSEVSDLLDRIRGGAAAQESGDNYQTPPNQRTGALGKFQVLPSNVPSWTNEHFGKQLTPQEFKNNTKAQDAVFNGQMGKYLKQARSLAPDDDTAIRMAAAAWYGGPNRMNRYDDPRKFKPNEPSFREYTSSVLGKSKSPAKFNYDDLLSKASVITGFDHTKPEVDVPSLLDQASQITGFDNKGGQPTTPTVATPQTVQPVPETPDTIAEQAKSALDPASPRAAVLTTSQEQNALFGNMSGMTPFQVPQGTLWVSDAKAKKLKLKTTQDVQMFLDKNPDAMARLIGKVENVGDNTTGMAVTTVNPQGTELNSSVVTNPQTAEQQINLDKQMHPDGVSTVVPTDEIAAKRVAENPVQKSTAIRPTVGQKAVAKVPTLSEDDRVAAEEAAKQNAQWAAEEAPKTQEVKANDALNAVVEHIEPPKDLDEKGVAEYINKQLQAKYPGIHTEQFSFLDGYKPGNAVDVTYGDLMRSGVDINPLISQKVAENRVENPTPDLGVSGHLKSLGEKVKESVDSPIQSGNETLDTILNVTSAPGRFITRNTIAGLMGGVGHTANYLSGVLNTIEDLNPQRGDSMREAFDPTGFKDTNDALQKQDKDTLTREQYIALKGLPPETKSLLRQGGDLFTDVGKAAGKFQKDLGDEGILGHGFQALGALPNDLPRMLLLPGGGIVNFAVDNAAQARGQGAKTPEVLKALGVGAGLGIVGKVLAPFIGSSAEKGIANLLGRESMPLLAKGVELASVPALVYGISRASGDNPEASGESAILMTAFHLHGLLGKRGEGKVIEIHDPENNAIKVKIEDGKAVLTDEPADIKVVVPQDIVPKPGKQTLEPLTPKAEKPVLPKGIATNEKGETTYAGETKPQIEERRRFQRDTAEITAKQVHNLAGDKNLDVDSAEFKDTAEKITGIRLLDEMSQDNLRKVTRAIEGGEFGKPVEKGVEKLPELKDNHIKDLSVYTPTLYREVSPAKAVELMSGSSVDDKPHFANTPNLAKGQGTNKGVMIELDSKGLQGNVNTSKPGWELTYKNGEAEFQGKYNKSYLDNVKSVTISKEALPKAERLHRALTSEKYGFTKTDNADGSITFIKAPVEKAAEPVEISAEGKPKLSVKATEKIIAGAKKRGLIEEQGQKIADAYVGKIGLPKETPVASEPAPKADIRVGDKVQDTYGRKGIVFKGKDGELHVEQAGTKARLPLSEKWRKTTAQIALDKATAKAEARQAKLAARKRGVVKEVNPMPFGPGAANVGDVPQGSAIKQLTEAIGDMPKSGDRGKDIRSALSLADAKSKGKGWLNNALSRSQAVWDWYTKRKPVTDYTRAMGDFQYAIQKASHENRQFVNRIKQAVPDGLTQEAMSNWIEADGDLTKLQKQADASTGIRKRGYEKALKLTDNQKTIATNAQAFYESKLNEGQELGIINSAVENYLNHVWKKKSPATEKLITDLQRGILNPDFQFGKKRTFQDFFEGEQAGYTPGSKKLPALLSAYSQSFETAKYSRQFVKDLQGVKMPDGRPGIAITGMGTEVPKGEPSPDAVLINPNAKNKDTGDYKFIDHPALRGWKWVAKAGEGDTPIMLKGDMVVHPDVYAHLKNVLGSSFFRKYAVTRGVMKAQNTMKQTMLGFFSGFHQVQEGVHAIGHRISPIQAGGHEFKIDFDDPKQSLLIKRGLQVSSYDAMQEFSEGLGGGNLAKHLPVVGKPLMRYQEWLFSDYIPRLKMVMAEHAFDRNVKRYEGRLDKDQIAEMTASQANAAFGELNYKYMGRNPSMQDALRTFLLAPDFLEARGKFVGQALKPYGREQLAALAILAGTQYVVARMLNKWLDDDYHWSPKDAFRIYHNGHWYGLRTIPGDILHLVTDPRSFAYHRLSPLSVIGITALTGRDDRGVRLSAGEQVVSALKSPLPLQLRPHKDDVWWEQAINSLGIQEGKQPGFEKEHNVSEGAKGVQFKNAKTIKEFDELEQAKAQGKDTKDLQETLTTKLDRKVKAGTLTQAEAERANKLLDMDEYEGQVAENDVEQPPNFRKYNKNAEGVIDRIVGWAQGIGSHPIDAFDKLTKWETFKRLENGSIIVERMSEKDSEDVKKKLGGGGKAVKLEHLVPLSIGGTNEASNLRLVTTEEHDSYTAVEIYLAGALHDGKVDVSDAQKMIVDLKDGKITKKEIVDKVGEPFSGSMDESTPTKFKPLKSLRMPSLKARK